MTGILHKIKEVLSLICWRKHLFAIRKRVAFDRSVDRCEWLSQVESKNVHGEWLYSSYESPVQRQGRGNIRQTDRCGYFRKLPTNKNLTNVIWVICCISVNCTQIHRYLLNLAEEAIFCVLSERGETTEVYSASKDMKRIQFISKWDFVNVNWCILIYVLL